MGTMGLYMKNLIKQYRQLSSKLHKLKPCIAIQHSSDVFIVVDWYGYMVNGNYLDLESSDDIKFESIQLDRCVGFSIVSLELHDGHYHKNITYINDVKDNCCIMLDGIRVSINGTIELILSGRNNMAYIEVPPLTNIGILTYSYKSEKRTTSEYVGVINKN